MDIGRLNIDEIQKTFRSSWDEADKIMEKYKNICKEYGVGIKYITGFWLYHFSIYTTDLLQCKNDTFEFM